MKQRFNRYRKGGVDTVIAAGVTMFFSIIFISQFLGYFYYTLLYLRANTLNMQYTDVVASTGVYSQSIEDYYKLKYDKLYGTGNYSITKKLYKFDSSTGNMVDISNTLAPASLPAKLERGQLLRITVKQTKQKGLQQIFSDDFLIITSQEVMIQNWGK